MANENGLQKYRLLGRSGLRVSPLCLGTMGFGNHPDWTSWMGDMQKEEAEKIFDLYVSKGGNFIDTANKYQNGMSEEWLGEFITKRGIRDDLVIATKYSLPMKPGVINSAGNHRKNMFQAVDASLKRLNTHYIDLYYLHFWDFTTSVEEIMRAMDDLVRSGKVHYVAISDAPAWQVSRMNMLADLRGWSPLVAYQGKYNLGERDLERDVIPMAKELNLAFVPWAVLGQGKYTGKYKRGEKPSDAARGDVGMKEKDYTIAEEVAKIAAEVNHTPSQVILNWTIQHNKDVPIMPLVGIRKLSQLEDNLGALEFELTEAQVAKLDSISEFDAGFPNNFIGTSYQTNPWLQDAGYIA